MMARNLSSDEIKKICANLVYQVAYAFYDTSYIVILKMMVHDNVTTEAELANKIGLTGPEIRKYLGTLHMHRLIRRQVNKEKIAIPEWKLKQLAAQPDRRPPSTVLKSGQPKPGAIDKDGKPLIIERERTRDVHYWYLDYREFANVVKYRLAMMRKNIDDKIKQEVGHRGYICPVDGRTYDPLDLSSTFDPFTNTFKCEDCSSELIEHDPSTSLDGKTTTAQDAMQRFNIATAPIREALKAVESQTVPSLNIIVWIAQNVKTTVKNPADGDSQNDDEMDKKFEVVIGNDQGDEEKEKLAQQQREQNALPHWYTHSTVTGQATTLGIADQKRKKILEDRARGLKGEKEFEDESLKAHYEILGDDDGDGNGEDGEDGFEEIEQVNPVTKMDTVVNVDRDQDEEGEEVLLEDVTPVRVDTPTQGGTMVTVNGVPKRIEDVTDDDHDVMTTDEYEAYAQAMYG
ncbi:uncharacterized protein IL334_000961 [Kwoniella shivajii]|uniref:HTH TFE/IIEalpha-type domain-containing protein n=1 Tax=Kwoniella shivajii TaxID=564305 RepID=A0ABZ1CRP4_9TREE|nr:hypothetical protein IL334_000961 [Kwoniella shivajii]